MTTTCRRHRADVADADDDPGRSGRTRRWPTPRLRLTPYAWAKLLFLRDAGPTEVGGFGITAATDCFLVEDVRLVRQRSTALTVELADEAVADLFDEQVDRGRRPEQFARIWIHTHPGDSPEPSGTDEETFARAFGGADWAVMFILARGGDTYARLRFGCGPGAELRVPVAVEYAAAFPGSDPAAWQQEYGACVERQETLPVAGVRTASPEELAFMEAHPDLFDEWERRLLLGDPLERNPYDNDGWM